MTKKYEILEHKADLKIKVFGKTKEELFLNALLGMVESQRPEIKKAVKNIRKIKITSPDLPALLVDFLSQALYLSQVKKEAYFEANFEKLGEKELKGRLIGQKVERFGEDIKAVTYYGLDVHQTREGEWEAIMLFDI